MIAQQREIVLDILAVFLGGVRRIEGRVDLQRRHALPIEAALELFDGERGDEAGERVDSAFAVRA